MMLRRLKEDVEKSLAPKEETIVEVNMRMYICSYVRAHSFPMLSHCQNSACVHPIPYLKNFVG